MGDGAEDNAAFKITGNSIQTKASFNFEFKKVYKIRVQTTDETNFTYEKAFIINIIDINDIPSNINLSASSINENNQIGTLLGTFTTIDQDPKDTHTYTLVSGNGDSGNNKFSIVNSEIRTNVLLDFETMNPLSVRIQTGDGKGGNYIKVFSITIKDINDYPTLDSIPNSAAINEDSGAQTVNLSGIGTGGEVAQTVVVTAVSDNPSLITDPQVIYANPNATGSVTYTPLLNAYGTATITVTISDMQSKNNIITRSFTVTINPVNDAPTLDPILSPAPLPMNSGKQSIELKGISSGAPNEGEELEIKAVSDNPTVIPPPTITYTSPNSTGILEFTPVTGQFGENIKLTVTVTGDGVQISREFSVTILVPPPVAPIGLTASVSEQDPQGTILMSWNDVDYELGYRIYVSVNSETNFSKEPIKSNGPNETTFTHTGLKADSLYYYKVVAYNSTGDSPDREVIAAKTAKDIVTGSQDIATDSQFRLYPNPTTSKFYIGIPEHSSLATKACTLILYNSLGELLWKDILEKGQEGKMIYIAQLPSGIYMLAIEYGDTLITRRVIKN